MEISRQRVPGHRADNRECPTTELAVTMSGNDELVVAGRAKMLTAGNIRSRCAAVHEVLGPLGRPALKTARHWWTVTPSLYWICPGTSSQPAQE